MKHVSGVVLLVPVVGMSAGAMPLRVTTDRYTATIARGQLSSLRDGAGNAFVTGGSGDQGLGIHRIGADHWATSEEGEDSLAAQGRATRKGVQFNGLEGASVECTYEVEQASGDLVMTQRCESPAKGVWGVEWSVANIPLGMNIIVPGSSGIKLTKTSPGVSHTFDYPVTWEAQLAIVEGQDRGFYVWAEDAVGRFKRLTVNRGAEGWRFGLTTMNYAPFDAQTACDSVKWHVNVYAGDWRVPAKRYRDWAEKNLGSTRIADQKPAWVKDIRCCVIMGLEAAVVDALTKRLDPKQTLLYIPGWRKAGYDRDYPTYDQPVPEFEPFLKRARELGYRVMLHVNYFGCDPLNPLYQQFEPLQVRSPWGNHDKEWWLWTRADPIIKFAYINPAHKPWRDLFVAQMKKLCESYDIDALHLDQTLCIYNDNNGLVDGVSMLQGNVALHKELRAALPNVALSGEGLDEVTYRCEAFAQRHAWGLNFVEGTWHKPALQMAHPISSYLFGPYTIIYGYLGCAPPTEGQLYAAWNENYQHWGVIPTLKPDAGQIEHPTGFSKQFFDEVRLWQEQKVDPEVEGPWPPEVFFGFKTARGERVARTADGRLLWGDKEISRTITDVTEVRLPGTIPGWRVYDQERLFGLDPGTWYPYTTEPRDLSAFHVEKLPEGFTARAVSRRNGMAVVRTQQTGRVVAKLGERLNDATCGSKPFDSGQAVEVKGPLGAPDGAGFSGDGAVIQAHPPWKATRKNPAIGVLEATGTGIAYARFNLKLPATGKLRFVSEVAMDSGAIGEGKTDGVTYGVTAQAGGQEGHAELHNATAQHKELTLDLTPFAGKEISLELSVHPGPNKSATFDWARWFAPRVEREVSTEGEMTVVSPDKWTVALAGASQASLKFQGNRYVVRGPFPGAYFLLKEQPAEIRLPLEVASSEFTHTFTTNTGLELDSPQYATAVGAESTVGGVTRRGLFTHPPNEGRTIVDLAMTLPNQPAEFHAFVGIREGSKSVGVAFIVEANGIELKRERVMPGAWHELTCDLSPWAGKPLVLSLIADSEGNFYYDWAHWGEPVVRGRTP